MISHDGFTQDEWVESDRECPEDGELLFWNIEAQGVGIMAVERVVHHCRLCDYTTRGKWSKR